MCFRLTLFTFPRIVIPLLVLVVGDLEHPRFPHRPVVVAAVETGRGLLALLQYFLAERFPCQVGNGRVLRSLQKVGPVGLWYEDSRARLENENGTKIFIVTR